MSTYKICFWLNTKSKHQTSFLKQLFNNENIDLQVRYIAKPSSGRIKLGWAEIEYDNYEKDTFTIEEGLNSLPDHKERIHIVMGEKVSFSKKLIYYFIENNIKWIHWNERFGIVLANKLNFNVFLFNLIRPFYLMSKRRYGGLVKKHALGCFAQGELAKKDFLAIGIPKEKIRDLYYTSLISSSNFLKNKKNGKTFLYVGDLSIRKGLYELIYAFSKLNNNTWELVLIGPDKLNGRLQKLVKELNLIDKIKFKGIVKHDQLSKYYCNSDVFILPSRFDGWGAVLNEAISFELPIISTDEVSSAFTLIKENGFIIKAGNTKQLTKVMQKYVNDTSLLNLHREKSKELSTVCSPENNVKRFIDAMNLWIKDNNDN